MSFRFKPGDEVKAPLYYGGRRKVEGRIVEGIWKDGRIYYEIEVKDSRECRFAAREEDIELRTARS
ncbi:MAG TPA: hypothetical protein VKZ59_09150 [Acidobacteriota bacterium]|nr:hypothetical protein [Acidobacteriota bacterium]